MRLNKGKIYTHLFEYQQRFGGYTGKDLDNIARALGFNKRTLKRSVEKWSKTDPLFAELKYIGQRSISITLEDIAIVNQHLKENITCAKQVVVRDINDKRIKQGEVPIPQSTLFRIINNLSETLTCGAPQELRWFVTQEIEVSDTYNLVDAHATLSKMFIYTDLKTWLMNASG